MPEFDPEELIKGINYLGSPTSLSLQGEKATPTGGASLPAPATGPGGTAASGGIMGQQGQAPGGQGFPLGAIQKILQQLGKGGAPPTGGNVLLPGGIGAPSTESNAFFQGIGDEVDAPMAELPGEAKWLASMDPANIPDYDLNMLDFAGEGIPDASTLTPAGEAGGLGLGQGLGAASGGLGALTGLLSLYGGAQSGNPLQAGQGALSTYNSLASLLSSLGYDTLPSLGSLGTSAISSVAPEVGAMLSGVAPAAGGGIGGIGGASLGALGSGAVVGGEALAGAGAAGAGAGSAIAPAAGGLGAGLTGAGLIASAYGLPVAIGLMAAMSNLVEAPEKRLAANVADTGARRGELGENVRTIGNRIGEQQGLDYANMSPEQLQQRWQDLQGALAAESNVNWMANTGGSTAPSKIPRLDPTMIQNVQGAYHQQLVPEMAALQDAMAQRGMPLDQFFQPAGATDILALAGRGTAAPNAIDLASLSPEQLSGIGPGNMLQALEAIRSGGSLTGLNQPVAGVQQARLAQALKAAEQGGGQELSQYFFNPQQMQPLQQALDQQRFASSYGMSEFGGGYQAPAQSPQQMFMQMLQNYQMPQAPAGMYAPSPQQQQAQQQQLLSMLGPGALQASQGGAAEAGGGPSVNPLNEEYIRKLMAAAGIRNPAALATGYTP